MTHIRSVHELKCWPKYFAAIRSGEKNFELRRNDRDFAVGDTVVLQEFDPELGTYTGDVEERSIQYLLSEEGLGVIHGFVVIGFGSAPRPATTPSDGELSYQVLADWHDQQARNAALRADGARNLAQGYAKPRDGQAAQPVAASRYGAVAELGDIEARFHAAAAALVQGVAR